MEFRLSKLFSKRKDSNFVAVSGGEAEVTGDKALGFFIAKTASGRETLAFRCPRDLKLADGRTTGCGLEAYEVGTTVQCCGKFRTLDMSATSLPVEHLKPRVAQHSGVGSIAGRRMMDTEDATTWDGVVGYSGDSSLGKLKDEQIDNLDFGLWR